MLLEAAVFDGYDMGILMPYIEGANKVMFARSGFFIRRSDHPLCRYWRVPKAKLIDELDLVYHQLIELAGGKVTESWQAFRQKIESALANPRRDAFISGMLLRIAPLADGGVLLSGDYHPGVVAVARRMRGVFLGKSSSWRVNATAEILRSNLVLELGLVEEQFEILDVVQELLGDGSVVPAAVRRAPTTSTSLPSRRLNAPSSQMPRSPRPWSAIPCSITSLLASLTCSSAPAHCWLMIWASARRARPLSRRISVQPVARSWW